jgi:hypothetical protein
MVSAAGHDPRPARLGARTPPRRRIPAGGPPSPRIRYWPPCTPRTSCVWVPKIRPHYATGECHTLPVIRFRFALTPLDRVRSWGGEDRVLHWFGLTDGWYWIELGDQELLRYTPETLRLFRRDDLGPQHPYVDYYVVRLWEDLIGLTPTVMQPVPDDLAQFIGTDLHDRPDLDDSDEVLSAAIWHGPGAPRAARIIELERTGPPHGIRIDMDGLGAEHLDRATWPVMRDQRRNDH